MEKLNYIAPEVEVLDIKIEKGFATSPNGIPDDYGWGGDLSSGNN